MTHKRPHRRSGSGEFLSVTPEHTEAQTDIPPLPDRDAYINLDPQDPTTQAWLTTDYMVGLRHCKARAAAGETITFVWGDIRDFTSQALYGKFGVISPNHSPSSTQLALVATELFGPDARFSAHEYYLPGSWKNDVILPNEQRVGPEPNNIAIVKHIEFGQEERAGQTSAA